MKTIFGKAALAAALTLGASAAMAQTVTIKSGPQGGVWYPISAGMAGVLQNELGLQVTLQAGGGLSNAITVGRGEGELGFSTPDSAAAVYEGADGRPPAEDLRTFGVLYNQYYTLAVPADGEIASVADLKGHDLVTMRKGSSTEQMTANVLAAYDLDYDDMSKMNFAGSVGDATNQLRDGQVDAYSTLIAHPASYMLELSSAMPMRIVGLDEATVEKIVSTHKGYSPITLKAGTYDWQTEDIMTVNGPVMLVTNANVPDDLVYNMAKALFEAHGTLVDVHQVMNEFTPENAAANPAVPIHPGALKFYKEVGAAQ